MKNPDFTPTDKKALISLIIEELSKKMALITQAALSARQEATHEDSKAENKYDTRGLEASYLAGAQAERAAQLKEMITFYNFIDLKTFTPKTEIAATALVTLESEGDHSTYLISPKGGGLNLDYKNRKVMVIGVQSPLGAELMGRKQGDFFELKIGREIREYYIVSVI